MLTMDEYQVVDRILPNFLEEGDLIKVKGEIFEVTNVIPTHDGWDIFVIDNYNDPKTITVPDDAKLAIVMEEEFKI